MKRFTLAPFTLALVFTAGTARSDAQMWAKLTAPRTKVAVNHPPQVALNGVARIAVTEFAGECGPEAANRLTQALVESKNIEVIDRMHLDALTKEHALAASGVVDPKSAAAWGKMLGPSAIVFGRVNRCAVDQKSEDIEGFGNTTTHVVHVSAAVEASVTIVDVTTARTLATTIVEGRDEKEARSPKTPTPPDKDKVRAAAVADFASKASRLVVPWQETIDIVVHDDDQWNLKRGAVLLKGGAAADAATAFRASLDSHPTVSPDDEKIHAKALYDMGVALICAGDPRSGLDYLKKSSAVRSGDITNDAIGVANRMLDAERQFALRAQAEADAAKTASSAASKKSVAPKKGDDDLTAALTKLKSLFDKGLITQSEYSAKKADLLKRLGS